MFNYLKKKIFGQTGKKRSASDINSDKVEKAIDYTISRYGKTLRDLARYDRGETISR